MKNTKKTILCLLMALALVLGMTACSAKEEPAPAEEKFSADDMVGVWADSVAGRAMIEISPADEDGRYDILISWGNGAAETYLWTMTATATDNNVLYYDDCVHTIMTFSETGEEGVEEVYTGGHGQFVLLSTNEIQWTDDIENAGDEVLFVSGN
jgi:hypothetical protein